MARPASTPRPRDGGDPDLDRVLNDLYGLSEDLDNARDWLADHWPGDLPAPCWFANGDQTGARPAVTVLAYCRRSELARAAELLDAQVVDAPREAGPWRWAVRDFGLVRIEAYGSAGPVSHLRACVHGHPRWGAPTAAVAASLAGALALYLARHRLETQRSRSTLRREQGR